MSEVLEKVEELEKKLKICETKFEQIEKNMEHYEKWYMDLVTKATKSAEECRKFLGKYTDDDLQQLERIINAVHGV